MIKKLGKKIIGPLFKPETFLYKTYHLSRGVAAAYLNQFPSRKMVVIGVTGTNGKTTVANLIAHILKSAGHKVGLSTTVNIWIGDNQMANETKMTTDNPFTLHRRLAQMAKAGTEYAIIETASHALAQNRTWGIDYDVAVFTNLTWDHLDYHKTFEQYRDAKIKLFKQTLKSRMKPNTPKLAIVNFDDEHSHHFSKAFEGQKYYFSVEKFDKSDTKESAITSNIHSVHTMGSSFDIKFPTGVIRVNLQLPGKFNIENALAAASTCYALGIPIEQIQKGLESAAPIPGRLEYIQPHQDFSVVVDYAHNPDGFAQALSSLRATTQHKLIVVFGAAGDRDKAKRPELGKIAAKYADVLILTEEDPGSEDPEIIIGEIQAGIPTNFRVGENLFITLPRTKAIEQAITMASTGDTVVTLAMGAQTVMATKSGNIPYNEREYISSILKRL